MQGKNAIIKSFSVIESNRLTPPLVGFFNLGEEVGNMVGLAEVVLYVVVLGGYAQLAELVLERPALLKEAMHLSFYLHVLSVRENRYILNETPQARRLG